MTGQRRKRARVEELEERKAAIKQRFAVAVLPCDKRDVKRARKQERRQ